MRETDHRMNLLPGLQWRPEKNRLVCGVFNCMLCLHLLPIYRNSKQTCKCPPQQLMCKIFSKLVKLTIYGIVDSLVPYLILTNGDYIL